MVAQNGHNSSTASVYNHSAPSMKMNLPSNLLHPIDSWTKQDVQKWIEYCVEEYSLGDVHWKDFEMNGKALLLLNENSFKQRTLRSGDVLHRALQQHSAMLKSLSCQSFPYQLWNNFGFLPPSPARHFNLPPFHPSAAGVLNPASMSCMHPAFQYMLNRPDMIAPPPPPPPSVSNHRVNQLDSMRIRKISASSSSSASSMKFPYKSGHLHQANLSEADIKRETKSPFDQHSGASHCSANGTGRPSVKHEAIEDEDVDVDQPDTVSTVSNRSNSPIVYSQLKESIAAKIRSQLFSRMHQDSNDVTNTGEPLDTHDVTRQIRYYHDRIDFRGDILIKPPGAKNCRILWEFLFILLEDTRYQSIIHWEDREKMIFRIIQADKLAALWGLQKNRLSMTYEKLSRGMRYYYSNNIISKEQSKRLLYRFMRSPDEIRKSMKRHGGTSTMIYPTMTKKPAFSPPSNPQTRPSNTTKDDSAALPPFVSPSSSHIHQQFLRLVSAYSPSCPPMISTFNPGHNRLYPTRNDINHSVSPFIDTNPIPSSMSIAKSDRSSSSSPQSLDSSHERTSDSEKQYCSPSQSLSSPTSSYSASTKRKQTIPISLSSRLSHGYLVDQPLNLAVQKHDDGEEEEDPSPECKRRRVLPAPAIV